MAGFETRFERLELKYLIDEQMADRVRRDIAPYCVADKHSPPGRGYPLSSLYLDTPSLTFHRAKERGEAERFKLRVRTYGATPAAALELKHKVRDVIDKTRVLVDRTTVRDAVENATLPPDADSETCRFIETFSRLVVTTGAQPALITDYRREAYTSTVDPYARVTFDRDIRVQRVYDWDLQGDPDAWHRLGEDIRAPWGEPPVVLELKCQSLVPYWLLDLIRSHALRRTSLSKYSLGIHLCAARDGFWSLGHRAAKALDAGSF